MPSVPLEVSESTERENKWVTKSIIFNGETLCDNSLEPNEEVLSLEVTNKWSRTEIRAFCFKKINGENRSIPTLTEAMNAFLRLLEMLTRRASLQVIMAMPAVRWRTMWWAARCIRWMSGSREKSWER